MKLNRLIILILINFIILTFICNSVLAVEASTSTKVYKVKIVDGTSDVLDITANSAYLMEPKSNTVLYSKNEDVRVYPASTTKILTAIIVLENCNLTDVATASYNSVMNIPEGYTTADIKVGEQLTVKQLLELLLVYSANDAANVLAEFTGGSIDNFVSMMNTKLNDLGLTNSHFTNPYGLHNENHYTTAHDLAYLMKYCLENKTFKRLASLTSCVIPATNLHESRSYSSTDELLIAESPNYYSYLIAGKTGFTSQAKECLVSLASKDDWELIGVILGSDNRFSDTKSLYEYGYSHYLIEVIDEPIEPIDDVSPVEDFSASNGVDSMENPNDLKDASFILYTMYAIIFAILISLVALLIYCFVLLFREKNDVT